MHSTRTRTEPLLALDALGVRYPHAACAAVQTLSLSVCAGECLGVVGQSGAGKSQAFLAVMGLTAPQARISGSVRFEGRELTGLSRRELDRVRGARIGMVFQNPLSALTPHLRVLDQVAEVRVRHQRCGWRAARLAAMELLERVQIGDVRARAQQYPHELSGGLRQRVMIAIALACAPSLLIADEPTTALDVTVQAQILALFSELKRERQMGLVLISHDLGVVAGLADRILVMQAGRLVEEAAAADLFAAPAHPETRAMLAAVPRLAGARAASGAPRRPAEASSAHHPGGQPPLLAVADLTVRYRLARHLAWHASTLTALEDVSLALEPGATLGVVGESGCGKSTLVRAVLGLTRSVAGEIVWLGRDVTHWSERQWRAHRSGLQLIFQDPLASLDPQMTAAALVGEPLRLHRRELSAGERAAAVLRTLEEVGLGAEVSTRYPHELSGGQCQRVAIARAMILKPRLLVCDEAVSALDVTIQAQILELIARMRREHGTAILFVSHNLAVIRQLCARVIVLYLGRVVEGAPAEALFSRPLHPYTRALLASVPLPDPQLQPARLAQLPRGEPPPAMRVPAGCAFHPRCPYGQPRCASEVPAPQAAGPGRLVACHRWRELDAEAVPATA